MGRKKYELESYFQNLREDEPRTPMEIIQFFDRTQKLPFHYRLKDPGKFKSILVRDILKAYQKINPLDTEKKGLYLTDYSFVQELPGLLDTYVPDAFHILNACCGSGGLIKPLLDKYPFVEGFDCEEEMLEIARHLYPAVPIFNYDYCNKELPKKWDVIVAHPPENDLMSFFYWLTGALNYNGFAFLVLPTQVVRDLSSPAYNSSINHFVHSFFKQHTGGKEHFCQQVRHTQTWSVFSFSEQGKKHFKNSYHMTTNYQPNQTDPNSVQQQNQNTSFALIELDKIRISPLNPRTKNKEEDIEEMAESVKKNGIVQAISLNQKEGFFEIICGERRFRASQIAGKSHIPAMIFQVDDEEAYQMALIENIKRKNLLPSEEANGYKKMMDNTGCSIEELGERLGQKPELIRSRLLLLHLTTEFQEMVDTGEITFGKARELVKFNQDIQTSIYTNHFTSSTESNWKQMTTVQFKRQLEVCYTTDLDQFKFDKKECNSCPHNTANSMLFADQSNESKCMKKECLDQKKDNFLIGLIKHIHEKYPEIPLSKTPFDTLSESITQELNTLQMDVIEVLHQEFPTQPEEPNPDSFADEESYKEANFNYVCDMEDFTREKEKINAEIKNGTFLKVCYIGNTPPRMCYYMPVKTENKKPQDPIQKAKQQCTKNMIKEIASILSEDTFEIKEITEFEEGLMVYLILPYMPRETLESIGIKNIPEKVEEKDYYNIYLKLSSIQKSFIKRHFIFQRLRNAQDSQTILFIKFMKQNFPAKYQAIEKKHLDELNKKIDKIKQKEEVQNQPSEVNP